MLRRSSLPAAQYIFQRTSTLTASGLRGLDETSGTSFIKGHTLDYQHSKQTCNGSAAASSSIQLTINRGFASSAGASANRRFYKTVHVKEVATPGQPPVFHVCLDNRPIKTPAKHVVVLPTKALAMAIAAEWEWQPKGKPQMHTMPLMSIAVTALDQPKQRDKVIDHLIKYVHTDATCCRMEEGSQVAALQAKAHDPLLQWAASDLGVALTYSHSVYGPEHSPEAVETVRKLLQGLGPFHLAAMEQAVTACKSFVIAAALLAGRISVREAFLTSRVEEEAQVAAWGRVEAGHDLDETDMTTRISGPSLFVRLMMGAPKSV